MTILDRYVSKEFCKSFALILASFICIFLIVDFFERIRMFISNNATTFQIVSFFFYRIPMITSQTIPASVLLAALVSFGSLSKHNEIVAMKANGISLYRTSLPIIFISLGICFLSFLISEFITPYSNQRADHIKLIEIQKRESLSTFKRNQIWYRGEDGIYNFKMFDPTTNTLFGITIHYLDRDFTLRARLDAEKARWENDRWTFQNVLYTRFEENNFPSLEWIPEKVIPLKEKPSDFSEVQKSADKMGFFELLHYIRKLKSEGYDATRYVVDLHGKIALTVVSVILVIIGISFSLVKTERSGGTTVSITTGVIIGFSYWIVHAFALSLGRSGTLPPVLSAWLANLIFSGASIVLFLRVKT